VVANGIDRCDTRAMPARLARPFLALIALYFVLIAFGALARAQEAPQSGQTARPGRLTDHDYAFELRAPQGWMIRDETEISSVLPDAVAGLNSRSGAWVGVIVESMPEGTTLAQMADLLVEGMTLVDREQLARQETTFVGCPAIRMLHRGSFEGLDLVFEHRVFIRADFMYQVIGWSLAADGVEENIAAGIAAFSLVDGEPRLRHRDPSIRDQLGVEWEVHGGTYTNLAYGLTVTPPSGWRLVVGMELDQMEEAAIVGLVRSDDNFFVTVEAEHLRGVAPERYTVDSAAEEWRSLGVEAITTLDPEGQRIEAALLPGQNVAWAKRFTCIGGVGVSLTGWALVMDPAAMEVVVPAFLSIRAATVDELAATRQRCAAVAQTPRAGFEHAFVGPASCYRSHVFTHFDLGVTLEVPQAGVAWTVEANDAVLEAYGEATLAVCHAPRFDVWLKLEVMTFAEAETPDLEEAHDSAVEVEADTFEGVHHSARTASELAGHAALRSRFEFDLTAGRGSKILWTAIDHAGRRVLWLTVWGRVGNVEAAQAHVKRLLAGLRTSPTALPRTTIGPTCFQDHAFGFTVDQRRQADGTLSDPAGPLVPIVDETPAAIASIGRILSVEGDGRTCVVFAVCQPGFSESDEQLVEFFESHFQAKYRSRLRRGRRSLEHAPWAGREALLLRVGTDRMGVDLRVVTQGRLAYAMLTEGSRAEREQMAHWMTLDEPAPGK
jgi:hypothetical protein